jgi:hypothetical protein
MLLTARRTILKNIQRILSIIIVTYSFAGIANASKDDFTQWKLNVQFVSGSKASTETQVQAKIQEWVRAAERVYLRKPALKITWTLVKQATKDGKDLSQMIFNSGAEYASFMDRNFDNVAVTKTSGHLIVLITDKLCIGSKKDASGNLVPKCWGGYGHFPHWVNPFSRKRGITILATKDQYTFAHELGHIFGLKHTFEPYVGFNLQCNDPYKPKGRPAGECNSCANGKILYDPNGDPSGCNGPTNIMDYCTSKTGNEFFNACQEERAANQRQIYMTDSGETNYFKLKGLAGEEICTKDEECEEGRYCGKGLTHNQCLEREPLGHRCTRAGECDSGRCYLLKCAEADDCQVDDDCGSSKLYCNTGVAELGRNVCTAELVDGQACTKDHQCTSAECSEWRPQDRQVSGICYTPNSKVGGESCRIDLECKVGKCNSNKTCVCKSDGDCKSGYWCDVGADFKDNVCKRKLGKGESCGVGVNIGHRCLSGKCTLGKCK